MTKKKNSTITLDYDVRMIIEEYDINITKLLNEVIRAAFSPKYRRKNAKVGRRRKVVPTFRIIAGLHRGLSQRRIAKELGISVSTVNRRIKELR